MGYPLDLRPRRLLLVAALAVVHLGGSIGAGSQYAGPAWKGGGAGPVPGSGRGWSGWAQWQAGRA